MENATLSKTSLNFLYDAARWARFIAILGFIFIGFMVLLGILIGPILSALNEEVGAFNASPLFMSSGIISIIYVIIGIIFFFPVYFLFQFSNGVVKAYKSADEDQLNASIHFLKMHFKFIGILVIISIAIYALAFIIGFSAALLFA